MFPVGICILACVSVIPSFIYSANNLLSPSRNFGGGCWRESYAAYNDWERPSLIRWAFELECGEANNLQEEHSRQKESKV